MLASAALCGPGRPTAAWNGGEVMARERGGASGQAPGVFRRVFGRRRGAAEPEPPPEQDSAPPPQEEPPATDQPAAAPDRDVPSLPPEPARGPAVERLAAPRAARTATPRETPETVRQDDAGPAA